MSFGSVIQWSIEGSWIFFLVYWFAMAFRVKRVVKRQSAAGRMIQFAGGTAIVILMWNDKIPGGVLASRFVPAARGWALAAALLTCAGIAIAIWARAILGGNWSGTVTLKRDHTLTRTGPYAIVRHPIYSGILLALAGTALAVGEWRGPLAVGIAFAMFLVKLRTEERFMTEQFGREYEAYRYATRALIPYIF
ncbi:MAG TPA: isoprenylcysteine carboxylmethyltransferase family protein [Terriglobia bacterium]|nr:isoprenylcysteine carboxylmethyltransferase family protein [Terriglobia bacterium]